jgi:hypothetical protein
MTSRWLILLVSFISCSPNVYAISLESIHRSTKVEIHGSGETAEEVFYVSVGANWVPALSASLSSVRIETPGKTERCLLISASLVDQVLLLKGDCDIGTFEQRITFAGEDDLLHVSTRVTLKPATDIQSVEDRYDFMPERHSQNTADAGPLDFVWSQNIKSRPDDVIPTNCFKSPAVMLQQEEIFAALLPQLSNRNVAPLALDLNLTSEKRPWLSYGAVPSLPHGHSYFHRTATGHPKILADTIEYSYAIVVSRQPPKLGYQRVVRYLWKAFGHPGLLQSPEMQQNVIRTELASFDSWRKDAWLEYANQVYLSFDCNGRICGTLKSSRNPYGKWDRGEPDAWFNAWFQTLRSAYGWYLYGRNSDNPDIMSKAKSVLTLALSAPQADGAFPTIYLVDRHQWIRDDGWAGYSDDYHAFCMSWTAYWMIRWMQDLTPELKNEILGFVERYGDFLLRQQLPSGVIPSWYSASLQPRAEFRDFNAETGVSALFLATLGMATGRHTYVAAAERAMEFLTHEVVPRERWFDFETFLSCARKGYDFYDPWTAQFPQNNLAEIQAPQAWLALFHATHNPEYLERGSQALDYLLLTQQVWNNPSFTPNLLGGFTTQNTDAEWSDARQGYAAIVLFDYFRETNNFEYLERAVAAARATFAVAPWENWAHTGYIDEPGALTGFHWGTGSAMTSVEIMSPLLGDAYIDLNTGDGVGFDECSIRNIRIEGERVDFDIESVAKQRTFVVRFSGVNPSSKYFIRWNGRMVHEIAGDELIKFGYRIGPLSSNR